MGNFLVVLTWWYIAFDTMSDCSICYSCEISHTIVQFFVTLLCEIPILVSVSRPFVHDLNNNDKWVWPRINLSIILFLSWDWDLGVRIFLNHRADFAGCAPAENSHTSSPLVDLLRQTRLGGLRVRMLRRHPFILLGTSNSPQYHLSYTEFPAWVRICMHTGSIYWISQVSCGVWSENLWFSALCRWHAEGSVRGVTLWWVQGFWCYTAHLHELVVSDTVIQGFHEVILVSHCAIILLRVSVVGSVLTGFPLVGVDW